MSETKPQTNGDAHQPQRTFKRPKLPTFANKEEELDHKLGKLALAFRIFAKLGFDEGNAGHITVRDPFGRGFWINPFGLPFALMKKSDLLLVDDHGQVIAGGNENKAYNAAGFAIHNAIDNARKEVDAACHSHSIYGKAFSTLGKELDITTQDSCVFYQNCALYPNFGGVVLDDAEGKNIAKYLGNKKAVILQNHGILTVGKHIESAVAAFIQLESACRVQLLADAAAAGTNSKTVKITDGEARFTFEQTGSETAGWFWSQPYFKMAEVESNGDHLA